MKIARYTPDQLILEDKPIGAAALITIASVGVIGSGLFLVGTNLGIGLLVTCAGIASAWVFGSLYVRRTQLILDNQSNRVELRIRTLFGYKRQEWRLQHLDRAEVSTRTTSGKALGTAITEHRAALVFDTGPKTGLQTVTLIYTTGPGAAQAAETINKWLATDG